MRWFSSIVWKLDARLSTQKKGDGVEDGRNNNNGNNREKKNHLKQRSRLRTPLSLAAHPVFAFRVHFCTPRPIQARPLGKSENMETEERGMGRARVTKSKEKSESERGRKRVLWKQETPRATRPHCNFWKSQWKFAVANYMYYQPNTSLFLH